MTHKDTVYSTDHGRHCKDCGLPRLTCACDKKSSSTNLGDRIVRLQRQVRGRSGKPITLVSGLPLQSRELKALAKELKNACGVGGSINGSDIIIQGDKREHLKQLLEIKGYSVKLSGG